MIDCEFIKLNQLCLKITDGSHYSPIGIEEGIPMLSVKDMLDNGFSYDNCKYVSEEDYKALVKGDCKPLLNDVLIAKDGSYLKHVFVIRKEIKQAILSSIGILRPNLQKVNPNYLKYYLQTNSVKETVSQKYVSGSALPRIILKNFGEIDVIKKDLSIQKAIAKILSDLDAKIELNNKMNTELEAMAKLLYDYWFVQFDFPISEEQAHTMGKPELKGKPYKSSGGKMVYNQQLKREIPEGWEDKTLIELCSKIGDGLHGTPNYVYESDYYFINGNNLKDGFIQTDTETKKVSKGEYEKHFIELNENTILLSINGTLGNLASYTGEKVMLGKSSAYINCNPGFKNYCHHFLAQPHMPKLFWNVATGSTIKNLSLDSIKKLKIQLPSFELLKSFEIKIQSIEKKRVNISKENQKLSELRDWLLPMLMNGQVTVGGKNVDKVQNLVDVGINQAAEPEVGYNKQS